MFSKQTLYWTTIYILTNYKITMHRSPFKTECKHSIIVQYEVVDSFIFFGKIPFLL